MLKINIQKECYEEIKWAWDLFCRDYQIEYEIDSEGGISIGVAQDSDIKVSHAFVQTLKNKNYNQREVFTTEPLFRCRDNFPDYLGTVFYLVNSLQEYNFPSTDKYGRFQYKNSLQCRFKCADTNLVADYFLRFFNEYKVIIGAGVVPNNKTSFFLTHDNDSLYGSWKEDGLYAIKKGRFDWLLTLIFRTLIVRPDWFNMDDIMKLEDQYDVKSTFYWLVKKGISEEGIKHADYGIKSCKVKRQIEKIDKGGFENGLHKSAFPSSFDTECGNSPFNPIGNRNHFLKITLPDHYRCLSESGIKLDTSLGFAENPGFRNSYGNPFRPFDLNTKKEFNIVEVPLHVMDATFWTYTKDTPKQIERKVLDFFNKNRTNCIITVLWHNKYFTEMKFKGYLDVYKSILGFIKENNLTYVTQKQIIEQY